MIRILNNIIEDLRKDGYSVNGRYGPKDKLAGNMDSVAITFYFDMVKYVTNRETLDRTHKMFYLLGVDSLDADLILSVEQWEYLDKLNQSFFLKLRNYQNSEGQQLISIISDMNVDHFPDYYLFEKSVSGLKVDFNIKLQSVDGC